jgi:hypothetical protein
MPQGQPTFFIVDPATGKVTYQFQGSVEAFGLRLPALQAFTAPLPYPANYISWQRQSDGAFVATVVGTLADLPGDPNLGNALLGLSATNPNPGAAGAAVYASAVDQVNNATRLIVDERGRSDFLQIGTNGITTPASRRKTAAVFATASFIGNGTGQMNITVAHTLGAAPTWVSGTALGWPGYINEQGGADANNLYLTVTTTGVFAVGGTFYYRYAAVVF